MHFEGQYLISWCLLVNVALKIVGGAYQQHAGGYGAQPHKQEKEHQVLALNNGQCSICGQPTLEPLYSKILSR